MLKPQSILSFKHPLNYNLKTKCLFWSSSGFGARHQYILKNGGLGVLPTYR